MTLEAQLIRIAEVHDLTSISINLYRREDGTYWVGSYANGAGTCGTCDNSSTTAIDAITAAIANLNAKRHPPAGDELAALSPMEEQANA